MDTAKSIDKKINQYLPFLNNRQKETVLTVVKTFAEEHEDIWKDKEFMAELDRRTAEYESGKAKLITLDELEAGARRSYRAKSRKRK